MADEDLLILSLLGLGFCSLIGYGLFEGNRFIGLIIGFIVGLVLYLFYYVSCVEDREIEKKEVFG